MKKNFFPVFLQVLRIALSIVCVWFGIRSSFPHCLLYYAGALLSFPYFQPFYDRFLKQKMILPLLVACLLLSAAVLEYRKMDRRPMYSAEDSYTLEYGHGTADPLDYITLYPDTEAECRKKIDLSVTGKQTSGCTFQRYGRTENGEIVFYVEDTQAPVIRFFEESITVYDDAEFDPYVNIASVSDPVDGELPLSECTAQCSGDARVPGTYTVTVTAKDRSGNTAEASYGLNVVHNGTASEEIDDQKEDPTELFPDLSSDMSAEELIRYIRLLYLLSGEEMPKEVEDLLTELSSGNVDPVRFLELLVLLTQ